MGKKKPRPDQRKQVRQSKPTSNKDDARQRPSDIPGPDPWWGEFIERLEPNPDLEREAIYALPEQLIDAIVDEIPEFFSEEEERFERDFARRAGAGFFLQRQFSYPRLACPVSDAAMAAELADLEERNDVTAANIRELLDDGMRQSGRTENSIRCYSEDERERIRHVELRRWGYAGWLVTQPEFRVECERIWRDWGQVVEKLGGFPAPPMSLMGERPEPPPRKLREFYAAYRFFCNRWGLASLTTWDLPIPLRPQLGSPSLYYLPALQESGLLVHVPWYLLRDKDIRLHELAEHVRTGQTPEHLRDWLDGKPKAWGYERFAKMLDLYIFLELCLKPRYEARLRGNVERLDYAIASFLCKQSELPDSPLQEAETVRKIRQEMQRRLRIV